MELLHNTGEEIFSSYHYLLIYPQNFSTPRPTCERHRYIVFLRTETNEVEILQHTYLFLFCYFSPQQGKLENNVKYILPKCTGCLVTYVNISAGLWSSSIFARLQLRLQLQLHILLLISFEKFNFSIYWGFFNLQKSTSALHYFSSTLLKGTDYYYLTLLLSFLYTYFFSLNMGSQLVLKLESWSSTRSSPFFHGSGSIQKGQLHAAPAPQHYVSVWYHIVFKDNARENYVLLFIFGHQSLRPLSPLNPQNVSFTGKLLHTAFFVRFRGFTQRTHERFRWSRGRMHYSFPSLANVSVL